VRPKSRLSKAQEYSSPTQIPRTGNEILDPVPSVHNPNPANHSPPEFRSEQRATKVPPWSRSVEESNGPVLNPPPPPFCVPGITRNSRVLTESQHRTRFHSTCSVARTIDGFMGAQQRRAEDRMNLIPTVTPLRPPPIVGT
jgi:hypothetical protein